MGLRVWWSCFLIVGLCEKDIYWAKEREGPMVRHTKAQFLLSTKRSESRVLKPMRGYLL
jgi:hypothetical protein